MLQRTQDRLRLKPERIAGDTAYGTGRLLNWLVGQNIAPHIPVWDKSKRDDGTLSRTDFRFDKEHDVYICPMGKRLKTTGKVHDGKTLRYRASKLDCDRCPLKLTCCPEDCRSWSDDHRPRPSHVQLRHDVASELPKPSLPNGERVIRASVNRARAAADGPRPSLTGFSTVSTQSGHFICIS
jgi:hypothetical protein